MAVRVRRAGDGLPAPSAERRTAHSSPHWRGAALHVNEPRARAASPLTKRARGALLSHAHYSCHLHPEWGSGWLRGSARACAVNPVHMPVSCSPRRFEKRGDH